MKKSDLPVFTDLPSVVVEVPELGGAITVRGLCLSQYLHLLSTLWEVQVEDPSEGAEGETADLPFKPGGLHGKSATLLSLCCVGDDGAALGSPEYWELASAYHRAAVGRLSNAAFELLDLDGSSAKKNSKNPPS